MADSSFSERLAFAVHKRGNPVCVGLDPRLERLPTALTQGKDTSRLSVAADVVGQFCCRVIDVVAPMVPVVKPQAAFFEQFGADGMASLATVVRHARQKGLLVILDGKRNDIGTTARAYAEAYLGEDSAWGADALTVNPYLGQDALQPFIDVARERMAGIFVLVKTSNPGSGLFQDLLIEDIPVYQRVAQALTDLSTSLTGDSDYGPIGAVVGATYPAQLEELRSVLKHSWILVPGFGSQGGTASDVQAAFDRRGEGAIVNSSRGIIFAHENAEFREQYGESHWEKAVESATRNMIQQLRRDTNAGRLGS